MTLYADPEFYLDEYHKDKTALIDSERIIFYLKKAQMILKRFTFDNIDEETAIPYEVKMCICEIAEIIFSDDKRATSTGGVTSESVGGWSKHYESSQQAEEQMRRKIKSCVYTWLADTGLLYSGVTI